jgi:hypothetical protein
LGAVKKRSFLAVFLGGIYPPEGGTPQNGSKNPKMSVFTVKNPFLSVFIVKVMGNDAQKPVFECIYSEKTVFGGFFVKIEVLFQK